MKFTAKVQERKVTQSHNLKDGRKMYEYMRRYVILPIACKIKKGDKVEIKIKVKESE